MIVLHVRVGSRLFSRSARNCCEGGHSSVSSQTGAGALELSVAAAASEKAHIAGDGAFTVAAG